VLRDQFSWLPYDEVCLEAMHSKSCQEFFQILDIHLWESVARTDCTEEAQEAGQTKSRSS